MLALVGLCLQTRCVLQFSVLAAICIATWVMLGFIFFAPSPRQMKLPDLLGDSSQNQVLAPKVPEEPSVPCSELTLAGALGKGLAG